MSEQAQTQEQAPKVPASKQAKVKAPAAVESKGRVEHVEHPAGDFTIEHL